MGRRKAWSLRDCGTTTKDLTFFLSSESGKKRKKEAGAQKVVKEIMAQDFVDLTKGMNLQILDVKQTPKKSIPRLIIVRSLRTNDNEKVLNITRVE